MRDRVHPMVQALIPDDGAIFQDDNAPIHTAHMAKNWYKNHDTDLEHMEWPPQSSKLLSICGASWSDKLETVTLHRRV